MAPKVAPTSKPMFLIRLGAYAVSKLAGELYAQAYLNQPLIIRTSGVFGPGGMFTPRGNFVELMLRLAKAAITRSAWFKIMLPHRATRQPWRLAQLIW